MSEEIEVSDQIGVWVNKYNNACYEHDSAGSIIGTCILIDLKGGPTHLIGWKQSEVKPNSNVFDINATTDDNVNYKGAKNKFPNHIYVSWLRKDNIFFVSKGNISSSYIHIGGSTCKKCKEPNKWAAPNQSDGSFLCYICRT